LPRWAASFGFQIIAALVVGLGLGLLAKYTGSTKANPNALGATLQTIGSSYVSLLQTAVVPLIFTAVVSSSPTCARCPTLPGWHGTRSCGSPSRP